MKTLFVFLFLAFLNHQGYGQDWLRLPWDSLKTINNVVFVDGDVGFVFFTEKINGDAKSGMAKTFDGGNTFQYYYIDSSINNISSLHRLTFFSDSRNGWSKIYPNKLIRTTDSGTTWHENSNGIPNENPLYSTRNPFEIYHIKFYDSLNGWIGGSYTGLINTTDGGLNWNTKQINWDSDPVHDNIVDINFSNSLDGWAVAGEQRIFVSHSTDGGKIWKTNRLTQLTKSLTAISISAADPAHIFIGEKSGYLIKSSDSGKTWTVLKQRFVDTTTFFSTVFLDSLNGISVGGRVLNKRSEAIIQTTQNGGLSWDYYIVPKISLFWGVQIRLIQE